MVVPLVATSAVRNSGRNSNECMITSKWVEPRSRAVQSRRCRAQKLDPSSSCGLLINVMKASKHRYRDDLSNLGASMRRTCSRCAGRPLSQRSMRPPIVVIANIFGQDLLQMALIQDEHVVQALGSVGSHPALGDGVGSRRSEWRANLGNTNMAHPTIERGAVTAVAVMNEKSWRLAMPSAAFDHLLSRPRGGGVRRHLHV